MMHVGTLLAAALAVGIVIWYAAFTAGQAAEKRKLQPFLTGQEKPQPEVSDPLRMDGSTAGETAHTNPPGDTPGGTESKGVAGDQPAAPASSSDARVAGQNYLILAESFPCEDAAAAVAFLVSEGFPAASTRIDRAGARANNGPRCVVYSTMGIPGEEYSKQWKLRAEHAKEARRLGALWKHDHRGTADFAQAYWAKYLPDSR